MGRNKLLLPIGGLSVLRRAVSIAVDGGLDPVLVVLGHQSERALEDSVSSVAPRMVTAAASAWPSGTDPTLWRFAGRLRWSPI